MSDSRMSHSFESVLLIKSVKRANKRLASALARTATETGHFRRTQKGKEWIMKWMFTYSQLKQNSTTNIYCLPGLKKVFIKVEHHVQRRLNDSLKVNSLHLRPKALKVQKQPLYHNITFQYHHHTCVLFEKVILRNFK